MSAQPSGPIRDIKAIAERLLSARFGGPIRLGDSESLEERTTVYRLPILDGPPETPGSIVVKQAPPDQPYDPDARGFPAPAWFLFNHWAGLHFLSQVAGDGTLTPRCYAADRAAGLVIMEDLGPGPGLEDALLGDNPEVAEAALIELAISLGRMHALTIDKEPEYDRIRDALGPHPKETDYYRCEWLAAAFDTTVGLLDITPSPQVHDELAALIAALRDPGPFRATRTAIHAPATSSMVLPG
jgi:hypothetical protein